MVRTLRNPSPGNPLPIDPNSLPADGTPVTLSQTFSRQVGNPTGLDDSRILSADDFEQSNWQVRRMTPDGWEFAGIAEGRPYDDDLRNDYGAPCKYEITPISPLDDKPIQRLKQVRNIGTATAQNAPGVEEFSGGGYPMPPGSDDMPPWMRWQMQQSAEERAEMRRRAEDTETRRREAEERQQQRDYERAERDERDRKDRADREEKAAASRNEMLLAVVTGGLGLLQAYIAKPKETATPTVERLLERLVDDRNNRSEPVNTMRDTLTTLVALDRLAETRAARNQRNDEDDEDGDDEDDEDDGNDLLTMASKILPGMFGGKPQGGGQPEMPAEAMEEIVARVLQDPDMVGKIAMRDPARVAATLKKAIADNPVLEEALLTEMARKDD